ncbi:hypothetical protein COLO4_29319 [Corchorus olitorius]|uniref:Uncharacterized protein n=1 Tax=Corchorus olitorius TaxID=93759 RepID=A0A1R3HF87_9ROSI|nr:hypothetical protein COLO4_29319 [Corchorus olitorius]
MGSSSGNFDALHCLCMHTEYPCTCANSLLPFLAAFCHSADFALLHLFCFTYPSLLCRNGLGSPFKMKLDGIVNCVCWFCFCFESCCSNLLVEYSACKMKSPLN